MVNTNGMSEFTRSEIQRIIDILNLGSPMGVFFKDTANNEESA